MAELKPIPDTENIEFKEKFIERYSALTDWEPFKTCSLSFLRKSIRVNTLKATIDDVKKRMSKEWILTPIPWCPQGFWIEHKEGRRDIGNSFEHVLGYIYVQEAASMIPPMVLNPQPGERVLDTAASPGSKTSQIAAMMNNRGVLVANDVTGDRLAALGVNLMRCGVANTAMSLGRGERIKNMEFDKILVDAPCSGTGTIRKSLKTITMWNPDMVKRLGNVQKKLITNAFNLLRPGGTLVYSTCSLEPEENEEVIDHLLQKKSDAQVVPFTLPLKRGKPVTEFNGKQYHVAVKNTLRLWPQDNDTEGFFVAKITKKE